MSAIRSKTIRTGIVLNGRPLSEQYSGLKADLVYLGSEFCQNLLPGPAEFGRALKLFRRPVVLATPLLTDELFRNIEAVIRARGGSGGPLEIVANDLGLIHLAAKKYSSAVRLSLGRVLGDFLKSAPDAFLEKFLAKHGIRRFEADSPELLARYSGLKGLACTYHIPYAHMAVTRFCPWEGRWAGEKCGHACLGKSRPLTDARLRTPLRLINCGYFAAGGRLPKSGMIDRIVYSPSVGS